MNRSQRFAWSIFGACVAAVAGVMVWITFTVLDLEKAEHRARASAEFESKLRQALWRMDSWLAPQLAREAARPYFEYQAFYSPRNAYTRILGALDPGEVLTPSRLLEFRSEFFPLHFQLGQDVELTSPQVPTGNQLDLAQGSWRDIDFTANARLLQSIRPMLQLVELAARFAETEKQLPMLACLRPSQAPPTSLRGDDFQLRQLATNQAKVGESPLDAATGIDQVELGPLLPLWLGVPAGNRELVFVRRVQIAGRALYQGFLTDWPRLRDELHAQAKNLFDDDGAALTLARQEQPDAQAEDRMLATVPVALVATPPPVAAPRWTPTRTVLAVAWLAMLLAVFAVGFTLHSTIAIGEKRARFASAVTHELRTPLTTFRMYTEMLADDMVDSPAQRTAYLQTLKTESDRLARLVENVLCYARLEDGRYRGRRERIAVAELLQRVAPLLERRAAEVGLEVRIDSTRADGEVEIDADAVAQILFNLVDNACKYARGSTPNRVDVTATRGAAGVEVAVRDYGPGIAREHRAAVFKPFERGERAAGDNDAPGVGLGLALARGLAVDLGGDLVLDASAAPGARFVLRIA